MGQVAVTVNGHSYQIACDDGQEEHLRTLAAQVDARVGELIASVGQVGDMRLLVMTSLLLADEASELKTSLGARRDEEENAGVKALRQETVMATGIETLAERIEAIADGLSRP